MDVTPVMLLTVCPLVFLASLIDAIAGGGGLISLPAYYLAGLNPAMAAGTNKLSASFGTLMAAIRYLRKGRLMLCPALFSVPGALLGAYLGAELLKITPEAFVRGLMLVGLPAMAILVIFQRPAGESGPCKRAGLPVCLAIGLFCGFYDGFFGPGTGTLLIILFTQLLRMDAVTSSGTAKVVNLASNLSALVSFLISGNVIWMLGLPAMACSAAGGYVGSSLAISKGSKLVRRIMLLVLAMILIKLAWDMLN
ncbi:MAG TPA: TSUP family transporter [Candidatus Faecaligallichristensenella faecipullorum]|nr:TSUP family transporter [Candidatus Faecaligallichristensenella faecipullorum]